MNIAWMHGKITDPVMSGLANRIEEINQLADGSPGFVWRLTTSEITPETLEPFEAFFPGFQRDKLFYNMSVWKNVEDLRAVHLRQRPRGNAERTTPVDRPYCRRLRSLVVDPGWKSAHHRRVGREVAQAGEERPNPGRVSR
jgi:hypothetical protein